MKLIILCLIAVLFGASADYCIKISILKNNLIWMVIPVISWGVICPILWYYIYQDNSITKTLVVFHPITMISLSLIGIFVFNEPITFKFILGLILAISAILIIEL